METSEESTALAPLPNPGHAGHSHHGSVSWFFLARDGSGSVGCVGNHPHAEKTYFPPRIPLELIYQRRCGMSSGVLTMVLKLLWRTLVRGAYKAAGLDSPYSANGYGVNWSKQRQRCLDRDSHTCRVCSTSARGVGRDLSVHHITPRSEFDGQPTEMNALDNLVTLCPSCHHTFEGRFQGSTPKRFVKSAREEV